MQRWVVGFLVVFGCRGEDEIPPPRDLPEVPVVKVRESEGPCAVVTTRDVTFLMGTAPGAPTSEREYETHRCTYPFGSESIVVQVERGSKADLDWFSYKTFRQEIGAAVIVLGGEALRSSIGDFALYVHETFVYVRYPDRVPLERIESTMKLIATRL